MASGSIDFNDNGRVEAGLSQADLNKDNKQTLLVY
jgi:hypothetical protein